MKFWKMNGAGNDFIILNALEENIPRALRPELARILCERHLSVGADGLMVVDRPETAEADFRMDFYNSDGSSGEMCGNGARCICRYGYETGLSGDTQIIETTAGTVTGQRIDSRQYRIRLNTPSLAELDRPVTLEKAPAGRPSRLSCAYIELGDPGLPHAVVELPEQELTDEERLRPFGRALRYAPAFPKGANVNFFALREDGSVLLKTYERGVEDFTYACGTGTGSVAAVLTLSGRLSGEDIRILQRGGLLRVEVRLDAEGRVSDLFLTGPTNRVAEGELRDEELPLF